MAKAYLDKIEKYADQAPGTMPFDLAPELLVFPRSLVGQLRLFQRRCAMATPTGGAGSTEAAQESILQENFLALLWQFGKMNDLLDGALTSQQGAGL